MDLSKYKSDKETSLVIYNNKLYRSSLEYKLIYLNDYFKKIQPYDSEIYINKDKKSLRIEHEYHNDDIKHNLYNDFMNNAIWLKNDLDKEIIYKIHKHLLYTAYENSLKTTISKEELLAKELLYKSNIMESYNSIINKISNKLYEVVNYGEHYIKIDFTLSDSNLTNKIHTKINLNHINSDGNVRNTLNSYIAYLVRDEIISYGIGEYNEEINVELLNMMLEKMLKEKFPHLIIEKYGLFKFKISFMNLNIDYNLL